MLRLRFRLVAVIVLSCLIGSIFEPVFAYAKNTPDWWPYWQVAKYRKDCGTGEKGKWNSKYCECWFPLGWATEPIKYKTEKDWRSSQFERYWKWWSRIRMNYNAMIKTEESEAIDTSAIDKIMQQSDNLLRAANALCVASDFDSAFSFYFPDYAAFTPAAVEDIRLLQQWINLETAWITSLNKSALNYDTEKGNFDKLNKLLWEHSRAIATADDVLKEIIGFGLGGAADFIFKQLQTLLDAFKTIEQKIAEIKEMLSPIIEPIETLVETMRNVVDQIADKLDTIKEGAKSAVGWLPFGIGDKLKDYIDEHLDLKEIVKEFKDGFNISEIVNNMLGSFLNLKNLSESMIGGKSIKDWKELIEKIAKKFNVALDELKKLIPLKAYNYGQTQALQAAGSQAAQMSAAMYRTNREIAGFMEMKVTAEHTKIARKAAARNNMVIAGKKAQASRTSSGRKVKLGFN